MIKERVSISSLFESVIAVMVDRGKKRFENRLTRVSVITDNEDFTKVELIRYKDHPKNVWLDNKEI